MSPSAHASLASPDAGEAEAPEVPESAKGPAPTRIVIGYGFWIFLLSDFVMFSAFFAAFAVLGEQTAGGPTGRQLFDPVNAFAETMLLLISSVTCGFMSIAVSRQARTAALAWGAVTALFGLAFLSLELKEFAEFIAQGAGPSRSAFLSAFFALVGAHGLHVTLGLVWLFVMGAQVLTRGFETHVVNRLMCFALFWHALDIVWVAVFTNVYLIGAR